MGLFGIKKLVILLIQFFNINYVSNGSIMPNLFYCFTTFYYTSSPATDIPLAVNRRKSEVDFQKFIKKTICIKKIILVLFLWIYSSYLFGQKILNVGFVEHDEKDGIEKFINSLSNELRKIDGFPYDSIVFQDVQNVFDNPGLLQNDFIGTLRPLVFVKLMTLSEQSNNVTAIRPIGIVVKSGSKDAFYNSYLILNKNLKGEDILKIRKLVLAYENSTSGDFMPRFMLKKLNYTSTIDTAEIIKNGWEIDYRGTHAGVLEYIRGHADAIGGTGELSEHTDESIQILYRERIPQDILVISKNLIPFGEKLEKIFLDSSFVKRLPTNFRIERIEEYSLEHETAYKLLIKEYQAGNSPKKNKTSFLSVPIIVGAFILSIGLIAKKILNLFYRTPSP